MVANKNVNCFLRFIESCPREIRQKAAPGGLRQQKAAIRPPFRLFYKANYLLIMTLKSIVTRVNEASMPQR